MLVIPDTQSCKQWLFSSAVHQNGLECLHKAQVPHQKFRCSESVVEPMRLTAEMPEAILVRTKVCVVRIREETYSLPVLVTWDS